MIPLTWVKPGYLAMISRQEAAFLMISLRWFVAFYHGSIVIKLSMINHQLRNSFLFECFFDHHHSKSNYAPRELTARPSKWCLEEYFPFGARSLFKGEQKKTSRVYITIWTRAPFQDHCHIVVKVWPFLQVFVDHFFDNCLTMFGLTWRSSHTWRIIPWLGYVVNKHGDRFASPEDRVDL